MTLKIYFYVQLYTIEFGHLGSIDYFEPQHETFTEISNCFLNGAEQLYFFSLQISFN